MHGLPNLAALPLSTDWIVFCLLVVVASVDTWRSGSSRAAALAAALPLASILFTLMPQAFILGGIVAKASPITNAVIFTVLAVVSFLACYRIVGPFSADEGSIPRALITGIATTIVVVVFALQIPALHSAWQLSSSFASAFGSSFRWWWIVGSFLVLAYIRT